MAKKKRKDDGGGDIPEWVVTFGDMMSLLLCFFILLQMFSELKQDHEFQRVVTAVKEAFGYEGGIGVMPVEDLPLRSMIEVLETMAMKKNHDNDAVSSAQTPGMDGPHMRVTRVREGLVFTIGGTSTFDPMSADVKAPVRAEIEKLVPLLIGRQNKIEIIGHAAAKYLPEGSPWTSLDDLSYRRAENVMALLRDSGIDDAVFRLKAVGMREPVPARAADDGAAAENRRVEIILTETTINDPNQNATLAEGRGARGG